MTAVTPAPDPQSASLREVPADPEAACRDLVLGPDDRAEIIDSFAARDRNGNPRRETIVVVLHRNGAAWTHVYRVVEPARGRRQAKLEKVYAGDRAAAAREWAAAVLTRPLARPLP